MGDGPRALRGCLLALAVGLAVWLAALALLLDLARRTGLLAGS